jgi:hypothetical protein
MFNVTNSDIEKLDITSIDGTIFYDIMLVRKPMLCPYCSANMIGYGHKLGIIKNPVLRDHKGLIKYIGKWCMRAILEMI